MSSLELLFLIVLVATSGFLSASEIALFSLSRFQLRSIKERFRGGHKKIKELLGDPGGLLITTLVMNEVVNISMSSMLGGMVSRARESVVPATGNIPPWALDTLLGTLITAPLLLFVCEVTPKVVGARANQLIAALNAKPLYLIYVFLRPVRSALHRVVDLANRWSGGEERLPSTSASSESGLLLKESDFLLLMEEGHKEGAIRQDELDLIKNVFDLDDTTVVDVFTPMARTRTIPVHTTLKSAFVLFRGIEHSSRIPVFNAEKRQIVGILHSKDLLKAKIETSLLPQPVETIMRKALIVSPTLKLNVLFRKLKQNKTHMAVVQETPYAPSLGIITMKDIFDTLFDDLFPDSELDDEMELTPPPFGGKK